MFPDIWMNRSIWIFHSPTKQQQDDDGIQHLLLFLFVLFSITASAFSQTAHASEEAIEEKPKNLFNGQGVH